MLLVELPGGSFAEWTGVVLGALGLFAGGAAGTFYGAVRQSRHGDRRHVLTDIQLLHAARTGTDHHTWTGLPFAADKFGSWVHLARMAHLEMEIDQVMRQLPWIDRALWRRAKSGQGQQLVDVMMRVTGWVITHPQATATQAELDFKKLTGFEDNEPPRLPYPEWERWDEAIAGLENYLLWKTNPRRFGWVRTTLTRLDLLRNGPWWWQVPASPFPWAEQLRLSADSNRVGSGLPRDDAGP